MLQTHRGVMAEIGFAPAGLDGPDIAQFRFVSLCIHATALEIGACF